MADIPDGIVLRRDRDLGGRGWQIWLRRGLFALLPVVTVLALFNIFGQRPDTSEGSIPAAYFKVDAASRLRSGLLYEARFHIEARRDLKKAAVVLSPGWLESVTVNTIEPSPVDETSVNGRLRLDLGPIERGDTFLLFMDFQVNPTNVGHRDATVQLYDGDTRLMTLHRTITIFP